MDKNFFEYITNMDKMTSLEYRILIALSIENTTQAELSRILKVSTTSISRSLKVLLEKNLVTKSAKIGSLIILSLNKDVYKV